MEEKEKYICVCTDPDLHSSVLNLKMNPVLDTHASCIDS